ncbi:sulfite exporter TauE/SafE family protein [Roseomonas xinghualingensis]|uniref:sulfite exporter TauE/SafE family protein n=1 Tax=Roseomonas xinghualingensis TaxID=2986475 RepID=UPI0021F0F215|nr:sulfite exporter TauE/SafE family protein [Roseomonas sp. SXEYE001]MCV4209778.1 sulfite exporter TauE/SafE family protein [Roseomonas sp. SXEYE001]
MPESLIVPSGAPSLAMLGPVVAIVAFSAIFRGFTGFGFAIIAVPLLSLALPPVLAVTLSAGLQLLGGLTDVRSVAPQCHWPSVRWLAVGALVASPLGTLLLAWLPPDVARLALAGACGVAVLALAAGTGFRSLPGRAATVASGAMAGLFNGLAAMPGPPVLAYYLASPLSTVQVRASLLVFFLFSAILSFGSLAVIGAVGTRELLMVLAGMPLMLAGSRIGAALFRRAGGAHRGVSLATLAVVAVVTAARGLSGLFGG